MTYTNFMDSFRGPGGGFGRKSWERALQFYNPSQIKTAIQQQAHYNNASVGAGLRSDYMQHHKGWAHGINRFQGPGGNLGKKHYAQAKAAGYDIADIPMLAAQGGMFLPEGAQKQWQMDMQDRYAPPEMPEWEMPGTQAGGGALLGTSAMGVRSNLGSQDNTGGTGDAFERKVPKKTLVAAQLMANPLG